MSLFDMSGQVALITARNDSSVSVERLSVGAQQRHDRSLGNLKRDVGHADEIAVADFEMFDLEQRLGHGRPAGSSPCRTLRRPR